MSAPRIRRSSAASWSCRSRTGPSSEKNPPGGISRSIESTATKDPKRFVSATRLTWPVPGLRPGLRLGRPLVRVNRIDRRASHLAPA